MLRSEEAVLLMKTNAGRENPKNNASTFSSLSLGGTAIALLLGIVLGMLIPFMMSRLSVVDATKVESIFETLGPAFWVLIAAVVSMAVIIALRQDELAVAIVIAVHLYIDWYLRLSFVAELLALVLLLIYFLARSPRSPWAQPRALWLWGLFLALAIPPAINGALTSRDALDYYPNIVIGAFIMFWLGTAIARHPASVRLIFKLLSVFAALIAVHTFIQAATGVTVFGSAQANAYIASISNYRLAPGIDVYRLGSFFIDPNWDGTFLAMMLFLPLGLFVESSRVLEKVLYLAEALIMLLAILYTYSAGAWVAACAGLIAFIIFAGRSGHRVQFIVLISVALIMLIAWFPEQVALQLQHAVASNALPSRIGAWQTALRVIYAYPLTGVGLGHLAYLEHAEPYRVPLQQVPLDHPHNSYLEWGAMAGLPVLLVFLALLSFASWQAVRNWAQADVRARSLLGGGIAAIIALSINSWSINGWTLPPIAAAGWLILGVISSPLLAKSRNNGTAQERNSTGIESSLSESERGSHVYKK